MPYGGREALTPAQVLHVFNTLLFEAASAWAAVAFVLSLFLGERAGCALQARDSWFAGMDTSQPVARIPKVNGKTKPRDVPLDKDFACLLLAWTQAESGPLRGGSGCQWPHPGQKIQLLRDKSARGSTGRLLFPGRRLGGKNSRVWGHAVSTRGLHDKFTVAQAAMHEQLAKAKATSSPHVMQDVMIDRISSHSCKKTAVTLLKEKGVATTIVSMLTGTSCRALDQTYYKPSREAQRAAQASAFNGITQGLLPEAQDESAQPALASSRFCVVCGQAALGDWRFCPRCGQAFLQIV